MKMTPQGKRGFLESIYGQGNVAIDPRGDIFVKKPGEATLSRFDPIGFDWGDVAEVGAPLAIEAGPAIATGPSILGAAGGGIAGNLARQGISGLLPGEEGLSAPERTVEAAKAAAIPGGSQAAVNLAFKTAAATKNILSRHLQRRMESPIGQYGQKIEDVMREGGNTDFLLTPFQLTQSRSMGLAEGLTRRHPVTASRISDAELKVTAAARNRLDQALERIHSGPVGDITLGSNVNLAFDDALNKAVSLRSGQARTDFLMVDQASNGQRVFPVSNAKQAIDELIQKFDVVGGGDPTSALVTRLKKLSSDFADTPPGMKHVGTILQRPGQPALKTGAEFQRLLQIYGEASAGKGKIIGDLDTAQERMIARNVFAGLQKDLDAAAQSGAANSPAATALKAARDNYRANSGAIDELTESTLGRFFNVDYTKAPEAISDKIVSMKPTEITEAIRLVRRANPDLVPQIQRRVIERALEKASPKLSTGDPAQTERFSAAIFTKSLPRTETLNALFANNSSAAQEIRDITAGFERIAGRVGEGSPTAPLSWAMDFGRGIVAVLNPATWLSTAGSILVPSTIAKAMTTQEGRQSLMTLTKNPMPGTRRWTAAILYMNGLALNEQLMKE